MNTLSNESFKPQKQPQLGDVLSGHQKLIAEVKEERWMNADRAAYGVNVRGDSLYDYERTEVIGLFSRTFEATLYMPPYQKGLTQLFIPVRVDELVVGRSNLKSFTRLLLDLQNYQQQTQTIVTAEQLMNAMGVESNPRLCDLELRKQRVEDIIAKSTMRPETCRGGPEAHGVQYQIKTLAIQWCTNPLDAEIRAGDRGLHEFDRLSGPGVYGSPDRLT